MKTLEVKEKYLAQHTLRPKTVTKVDNIFAYLAEFSPEFPTTRGYINEWTKWLRETKHLADITTHRHYTFARSITKFVCDDYGIPNPFTGSIRPKYDKKKPRRFFTADQGALIIRSCHTDLDRALVMTLLDSGCRIQDLEGLKANQVNHNSFTTNSDKKTGSHTYRCIPELCLVLKKLAITEDGYVFKANPHMKLISELPATSNALSMRIRNILIRAGFKGSKLGAHTLRHSTGSILAKFTKSALIVKAVLGHADIETSMRYIHDNEQDLAQEISPLQIIADTISDSKDSPFKQVKMITQSESKELTIPKISQPSPTDILIQESYPIPPYTTKINPTFDIDDLMLIRRAFISLCNGNSAVDDPANSRLLWRRILRKVKFPSNMVSTL